MNRRMKKNNLFLLTVLLLIGTAFMVPKADSTYTYNSNADGTITITGYQLNEETVQIPETVDGKTVSGIADKAFQYKDVKSVTIPASVKSIGNQAFQYCAKLTTVTFAGEGLTAIGKDAFAKCGALTTVALPATLASVGDGAFSGIKSLTLSYTGLTAEFGKDVFKDTTLKEVTLKQSSTLYAYVEKTAKKLTYAGPYFENLEQKVNVGNTLTLELKNATEPVVWSSSKETVATVENGVVTGVKAGTAKITAATSGERLVVTVTVNNLKISSKKATITVGYSTTLTVKNASAVTWSTSNKKVATVNKKGKVTGKKIGKATITAKVGNASYKCSVTVKANSIKLPSYSKNAYHYSGGAMGFSSIKKTAKGYQVKGHFINGTSNKVQYIKNIVITVKDGKKVLAKKYIGTLKLNTPSHRTKAITINFTGSQVKKKVDLRNAVVTVTTSGGRYYYETTRTIEVPVNQ